MPTYQKCGPEVSALSDQIIANYHGELKMAELTVLYLFAFADKDENTGEPKGPAVKHHGYPALAVIKVNSLKDRVAGLADATVIIDGDQWPEMDDARREALIDHELSHLEIRIDEDGELMADDVGRPKLKIRQHDFEIGGFNHIVERHGYAAEETKSVQKTVQKFEELKLVQGSFQWG